MARHVAAVRLGLRAAWQQPWLVILVWALFFGAALLAATPAWRWWNATLSLAPEGDRLLDGLNAALLRELSHYDRSPSYVIALATFSAFLLATLLLNPFVAGGALGVLYRAHRERQEDAPMYSMSSAQAAPFTQAARVGLTTFFTRGAEHYGLFLRMLLLAGVIGVILAVVFVLPLMPILHISDNNYLERLYLFTAMMFPVAIATAFGLASLLLDIARIRAMREGQRRAWRAIAGGVRFVWRNARATIGIGLAFALLTLLTFVVYFVVASAFTPKSWIAILMAMAWQQLLAFTRTGLRVAMLGAELELVSAREPVQVASPMTATSVIAPVSELPPLA